MNRIPVYEVIDQRPVELEPGKPAPCAVFRPLTGDKCTIKMTDVQRLSAPDGCACSVVFDDASQTDLNVSLVMGEADCAVDRALEAVLSTMVTGEVREFCLAADKRGGRVSGRVRLVAIKKRASGVGWGANDELKLAEAERHKDVGNRLYGQGRYADAFHRFNRSVRAVLFLRDADAAPGPRDALYVAVCNNMAACQLHLANFEHAFRLSDKALTVDPDNVKALVRRCRASVELRMFDAALADANRALSCDPGNAVAEHYRRVAERGVRHQDSLYKDMVKKMFLV